MDKDFDFLRWLVALPFDRSIYSTAFDRPDKMRIWLEDETLNQMILEKWKDRIIYSTAR